ncbi:MAG: hypothetical protein HY769_09610 [Candidatus Stahlbacteria bacterium]|nr:hypothetical protein [Candidatus Stahlbacteria bacterium]
MKYNKAMLWVMMCCAMIVGCGREGPSDDELSDDFKGNEFYTTLGATPRNGIPGTAKEEGFPVYCWKIKGRDTVTFVVNKSANEANMAVHIKWFDTLVVVYDTLYPYDTMYIDTVYKPAPFYNGDVKFYYKVNDHKWRFDGLTPCEIKSDSAAGYVGIDSVRIEVTYPIEKAFPIITSPTQYIVAGAGTYPYFFDVGDSIRVTVYRSGTLPDNMVTVMLHVPLGDTIRDWFKQIAPGVWQGTWVPKNRQGRWGWVSVYDLGAIFHQNQMAERTIMWGIPYKVH